MSNSTSRTCCQRCIVPLIAIILGLQLVFVWVLVWHHELFKVAFNDLSTLTTSSSQSSELTQQQRRGKEEEEDDDDDVEEKEKGDQMRRGFRAVKKHARVSSRKVLQRKDEPYRTFPVKIISPHSTLHVPEASRAVLETMLGRKLVEVDFPDLSYRASAVIRSQHPRMFAELPAYGFDNSFRNPCWRREVENPTQNSSAGHLVCLPYAYVLGQPKCGTSDLFERMKEHPDIM